MNAIYFTRTILRSLNKNLLQLYLFLSHPVFQISNGSNGQNIVLFRLTSFPINYDHIQNQKRKSISAATTLTTAVVEQVYRLSSSIYFSKK